MLGTDMWLKYVLYCLIEGPVHSHYKNAITLIFMKLAAMMCPMLWEASSSSSSNDY